MSGHFPVKRIRTIMKSSVDVEVVSKDSLFIMTRAAEFFVKQLSQEAYRDSNKPKKLDYKNIANVVNNINRYDFLREMVPHKITVDEYYKIMKEKCGQSAAVNDNELSCESSEEETTNTKDEDSDVIILD